jgi:hypothetical protein
MEPGVNGEEENAVSEDEKFATAKSVFGWLSALLAPAQFSVYLYNALEVRGNDEPDLLVKKIERTRAGTCAVDGVEVDDLTELPYVFNAAMAGTVAEVMVFIFYPGDCGEQDVKHALDANIESAVRAAYRTVSVRCRHDPHPINEGVVDGNATFRRLTSKAYVDFALQMFTSKRGNEPGDDAFYVRRTQGDYYSHGPSGTGGDAHYDTYVQLNDHTIAMFVTQLHDTGLVSAVTLTVTMRARDDAFEAWVTTEFKKQLQEMLQYPVTVVVEPQGNVP